MNVPAIAKKTYENLQNDPVYLAIFQETLIELEKIKDPLMRAKLLHYLIDEFNREVFSEPLVKALSPCKAGCTACCHTQVSVTSDEAALLFSQILKGTEIDQDRLEKQMACENDSTKFYQLSYEERRCIFLDDNGHCRVYELRPAVCRTNAVLGSPDQCRIENESNKQQVLVKTSKSDMAIYAAYTHSPLNGTLPFMIGGMKKL